jgi:hypothetical protein
MEDTSGWSKCNVFKEIEDRTEINFSKTDSRFWVQLGKLFHRWVVLKYFLAKKEDGKQTTTNYFTMNFDICYEDYFITLTLIIILPRVD